LCLPENESKTGNATGFSDVCACVFSLTGVVEVYRVTRRVELGIKATAVCSEKLQQLLKDVSRVWNNLMGFMSLAKLAVRSQTVELVQSTGPFHSNPNMHAGAEDVFAAFITQTRLNSSSAGATQHIIIEHCTKATNDIMTW